MFILWSTVLDGTAVRPIIKIARWLGAPLTQAASTFLTSFTGDTTLYELSNPIDFFRRTAYNPYCKDLQKGAALQSRNTSARRAILELLQTCGCHLTVQEVYERVQPQLPSLNPSTVYRNLRFLVEQGSISVSDMGLGTPVYEALHAAPHHHLICERCGSDLELSDGPVRALFAELEQTYHFKIITNHLVLFGLCPTCRQKGQDSAAS